MRLVIAFAAALFGLGGAALAAEEASKPLSADPFAWLEDIHGKRALTWVKGQNARTATRLEGDKRFEPYRQEALAIFTAKDRIPYPEFRGSKSEGGGLDNVWQDAAHPHGVWRRTTLASYRTANPQWDQLLDLDALSKAEGKSWFWKGARCLRPEERYCLINLSNGGGDAVTVREFDTQTKSFVAPDAGGFTFANGKQSEAWLDKDTLIAGREWGPGTLTNSGYAYILKRVKRGEPLSAAKTVFQGQPTDGGGARERVLSDPGGHVAGVIYERAISDYDVLYFLDQGDRPPAPIDLPRKSRLGPYVKGQLAFTIQEDWKGFKAGDLLAYDLKTILGGAPKLILRPTEHQTIDQVDATRDHLLVAVLDDVKGKVLDFSQADGKWTPRTLDLPKLSAVSIRAASEEGNDAFITSESFLDPTTLWLADVKSGGVDKIKALPARFDGSGDVVEQHWAVSKDGAKIPYFLVRPTHMKMDGSTPTQMFGYGGFLISEVPAYKPEMGKLWLEKGGAYVLTNIRGGGEFGPRWHDAALRENRQRAFDDFAAVAQDLFARKVTSPRRLGIYGRSNGGVLTTVSMTQHPDYWNAIVIESPLVDMLRYNHLSAGASWMGEYGDPDVPADRAFIAKYSAYQLLKKGVRYPEPYITTNTEDDRVHPGHARKLAAKLENLGDPYLYYENTFGGHANDADPELNARRWARHYVYLAQKLMD
jgi:prolyl oligopeptidase